MYRTMCYDEFLGLLNSGELITDEFPERDAMACFVQSMMTQINEYDSDRHMKMSKVEFYEAIARTAEILSFPPPGAIIEDWPIERREAQNLYEKMENILPVLISISKKEFRERYRRPTKDNETGLYIVPTDNPVKMNATFSARV